MVKRRRGGERGILKRLDVWRVWDLKRVDTRAKESSCAVHAGGDFAGYDVLLGVWPEGRG